MRLRYLIASLLLGPIAAAYADPFEAALLAESTVEYEIRDGSGVIVGRAPLASLELRFDDADVRDASLQVALDPARFSTGNIFRDTNARRTVFEVSEFPTIAFAGLSVAADPADLPEGSSRTLIVRGRLRLHGVEHELEVPLEVTRTAGHLSASGSFEVLLSDYGMTRPSFLFLVVEDRVVIHLQIEATLTAVP